jgi:hypothetical protein
MEIRQEHFALVDVMTNLMGELSHRSRYGFREGPHHIPVMLGFYIQHDVQPFSSGGLQ